jgi:hypothetical protein
MRISFETSGFLLQVTDSFFEFISCENMLQFSFSLLILWTPYLIATDVCVLNSPIVQYSPCFLPRFLCTVPKPLSRSINPRCFAASLISGKSTVLERGGKGKNPYFVFHHEGTKEREVQVGWALAHRPVMVGHSPTLRIRVHLCSSFDCAQSPP